MVINEQVVAAYRKALSNPQLHGLPFYPLKDYFQEADEVTALHELAEPYIKETNGAVHKFFVYVFMKELYGQPTEKDEKGNFGFKLKFVKPVPQDQKRKGHRGSGMYVETHAGLRGIAYFDDPPVNGKMTVYPCKPSTWELNPEAKPMLVTPINCDIKGYIN